MADPITMRNRDRIGLNLAPLLLRLMLGLIFLQSGLGKLIATMPVQPADEPVLKAMGAGMTASPPTVGPDGQAVEVPPRVRKLYNVSLRVHRSANPPLLDGGGKVRPTWPPDLAAGGWPRYLGWGTALVEFIGGACLLAGLATRLWSVGLIAVMVGAMWLTQLGPAMQRGETILAVLPAYTFSEPAEWRILWLQFALLMSSAALLFLGSGRLALDALLLGRGGDDEDE
jgi:uncharacterized membrane protein YphA (DoxX/SURF4 family)